MSSLAPSVLPVQTVSVQQLDVRDGDLHIAQRFWAIDNHDRIVSGVVEQFPCDFDGTPRILAAGNLFTQGRCFIQERYALAEHQILMERQRKYLETRLMEIQKAIDTLPTSF